MAIVRSLRRVGAPVPPSSIHAKGCVVPLLHRNPTLHLPSINDPWYVRGPLCRRWCAPPQVRRAWADWHRRVRMPVATPSGTGRGRRGGHMAAETVAREVSTAWTGHCRHGPIRALMG